MFLRPASHDNCHKITPTAEVRREEERGNTTKHSDDGVQRFIDHKSHLTSAFTVVTILVKMKDVPEKKRKITSTLEEKKDMFLLVLFKVC